MWRLANPWFLALLVIPLALLIYQRWSRNRGRASVLFSGGPLFEGVPISWRGKISPHLHFLRYPGLILLILALSRPQSGTEVREILTYGVDIMLVLDVSASMAEQDMVYGKTRINRLATAKHVISGFISGRDSDRIGLIAFASQSITRCPLTVDYNLVNLALEETNLDLFPKDMRSTAIGNALATSVSRLQKSDARSRIVILLTDGANTAGNVAPTTASDIATSEGIRVYTIGFGSVTRNDVDEETLRQIAEKTNGRFFRSTSLENLEAVYQQIDDLEKSEVEVKNFQIWKEWFHWFLWSGCAFLLIEVFMNQVVCRRIP